MLVCGWRTIKKHKQTQPYIYTVTYGLLAGNSTNNISNSEALEK